MLWNNENITEQFEAQTIELDLTEYDAVDIAYAWNNSETQAVSVSRTLVGSKGILFRMVNNRVIREFMTSTNGIDFEVGKTAAYNATCSNNNGVAIPHKIYGVKF